MMGLLGMRLSANISLFAEFLGSDGEPRFVVNLELILIKTEM